ncbi:Rne/Rng family ribonuclease [Rhizobium oryziradicis]|uniref:Ribonuclease E n=1 Tax=Rhizobium oryziradicis TaxID=1867956 RepID=A0A1Q8ZMY3_9HYPH|nr:Rne/Rng family ribonuclease [Rhizobium oryziradicis]OLP43281.1 ribonuclease [Rhizobium oryziradicis]
MADKMLIDASHEEETRVVVVRGNRIEEFDFESQHKKQIRGNIYLAKVTRVEPSLQAAFVDYGGNRHGFLAFAEIHPDYYQIPLADRQALLRAEAEEHGRNNDDGDFEPRPSSRKGTDPADAEQPNISDPAEFANEAEEVAGLAAKEEKSAAPAISMTVADIAEQSGSQSSETQTSEAGASEVQAAEDAKSVEPAEATAEVEETSKPKARRPRKPRKKADAVDATADAPVAVESDEGGEDNSSTGGTIAAMVDTDSISEESGRRDHDDDDDDDGEEKEVIESVGAEDAMEEVPDRVRRTPRKQYRIQEVIKRRQILLVQVAKEERGNKGAALTTYLSLAGRYSVLMPNTARGGGISRKITSPADRKRLKEVARELDVPLGMGVILRTAGANRTKVEVKRDFEYLMRLWENVRTLTLSSMAPCLVYEEGSLIKRSIRDLYNKDISEIIVSGEEGYREAKDFMKMLMPSHAKVVQPYRDIHPIFARSGIEAQLDRMLQPQVTLKSGGYIIINQTEALVAIDVNSGRSTREYSIEDTALQTNLEAAEEVARQLRLRDLAGLIVIDFIDMEEKRNNRAVEKKLKDCLKDDRARIQVGRISHFGLLEMSRQRIRASVLESTTQVCPHCSGTGLIRSQSSVALHVLRGIEEFLLKCTTHDISVRTLPETALYLLNHKRSTIIDYEKRFGVTIVIEADASVGHSHFAVDKGEPVANPVRIETLMPLIAEPEEEDPIIEIEEDEDDVVVEVASQTAQPADTNSEEGANRKRKRRRRRRGKNGNGAHDETANASAQDEDGEFDAEGDAEDSTEERAEGVEATEDSESQRRKRRRRGKRGGRRGRDENGATTEAGASEEGDVAVSEEAETEAEAMPASETVAEAVAADVAPVEALAADEKAPAKPRRARKPKATAKAAPVEEAVSETVNVEVAEPTPVETPVEVKVEAAPEPVAPVVEAVDVPSDVAAATPNEAEKPVRANRESNVVASEPVVTSTASSDEAPKPKKGGWWTKRGFL